MQEWNDDDLAAEVKARQEFINRSTRVGSYVRRKERPGGVAAGAPVSGSVPGSVGVLVPEMRSTISNVLHRQQRALLPHFRARLCWLIMSVGWG
jgi:hypothetical protein